MFIEVTVNPDSCNTVIQCDLGFFINWSFNKISSSFLFLTLSALLRNLWSSANSGFPTASHIRLNWSSLLAAVMKLPSDAVKSWYGATWGWAFPILPGASPVAR